MSGSCGWFPLRPEEIRAWVDAHRNELPQTLDALATFPIPFRKAIVNAVSSEQRISFWREHLSSFVGPDTDLTTEQRTLVCDALDMLPDIFGGSRVDGQARVRALEGRMRELLTREQAARMFGTLGPPEPSEGLPLPAGVLPASATDSVE